MTTYDIYTVASLLLCTAFILAAYLANNDALQKNKDPHLYELEPVDRRSIVYICLAGLIVVGCFAYILYKYFKQVL